jgi:hypothetical protein
MYVWMYVCLYLRPPCTTNIDLRGISDHATPASVGLLEMVVAMGNQLKTLTNNSGSNDSNE